VRWVCPRIEIMGVLTHEAGKTLESPRNAYPGVYLDEDAFYGVYVDLKEASLVQR